MASPINLYLIILPSIMKTFSKKYFRSFARSLALVPLFLGCFAATPLKAAEVDEVRAYTVNLSEQVFTLLEGEGINDPAIKKEFRELLTREIDTPLIGKVVLGPTWRQMTPQERERYLEIFSEWTITNLVRRFGQFKGKEREVVSIQMRNKDYLVQTLITYNSIAYRFDWRVRPQQDGSFKLIDLVLEGLSIVASHQSEFRGYLRKNTIDDLIQRLENDERTRVLDSLPIG